MSEVKEEEFSPPPTWDSYVSRAKFLNSSFPGFFRQILYERMIFFRISLVENSLDAEGVRSLRFDVWRWFKKRQKSHRMIPGD